MEFEAKEPPHSRLPTRGLSGKNSVLTDALGMADRKLSRVDETDAGAGSVLTVEIRQHLRNESHKALVAHLARKLTFQIDLDILSVISFEGPVV